MLSATRTELWRRWVAANAAGHLVGLGLTLMVGFGAFALLEGQSGLRATLGIGALVVAMGAIQGTVVGLAQWWALQHAEPIAETATQPVPPTVSAIPRRIWWAATLRGALIAWFLGALPGILTSLMADPANGAVEPTPAPSFGQTLLLAAMMGVVLGFVLALPQWRVLRRHVARAGFWIPVNSLAWALGMPLIFAGFNAAQATPSPILALATTVVALVLSGTVVGAVHGIALVQLAQTPRLHGEA